MSDEHRWIDCLIVALLGLAMWFSAGEFSQSAPPAPVDEVNHG